MSEKETRKLEFTYTIQKGKSGAVYVGQIKEVPAVIVQAKTPELLVAELLDGLSMMIRHYPEQTKHLQID